jgi:AraC-like DNA-binding protein
MAQQLQVLPINSCLSKPGDHGPASYRDQVIGDLMTGSMQRQIRALQKWRLKRVVEHIEDHLSAKIALSDLADVAGLSPMHFASQFRTATGLRPHEFLLRRRIQRAEELLRNSTMPIVEVAMTVGFQTQAHLTTVFKRFTGCPPGRWRAINQTPIAPPQGRRSNRAEIMSAGRMLT